MGENSDKSDKKTGGKHTLNIGGDTPPQMSRTTMLIFSAAAVLLSLLLALNFYNIFLFAFLIGSCALVCCIFTLSLPALSISLPILSYGVALLITSSPIYATAALLPFPAAAAMAYSIRKKKSRMAATLSASLFFAFGVALFALVLLLSKHGRIDADILRGMAGDYVDGFWRMFESVSTTQSVSVDALKELINFFLLLSPAIIIITFNISAYITTQLVLIIYRAFGLEGTLAKEGWRLHLSGVSAIVYLLTYFLLFLYNTSEITLLWAIYSNIVYILLPAFFLVGVGEVIAFIKRRKMFFGNITLIFIAAIFLLTQLSILVAAVSLLGAFYTAKKNKIFKRPKKEI